jgi:hypothetical protein
MLLLRLGDDTLDLSDYTNNGVFVGKVDIGAPAVREVAYDLPDRDGTLDLTTYVGARLITLSGQIIASPAAGTRQQILDRLSFYCRPGSRPTLTVKLNDDVPRTIGLRGDQCAAPIERPGRCPFAASWKAPDPRFYAAGPDGQPAVSSVTVYPPMSATQGRAYDLVFPRIYPSNWGGSGLAVLDVAGDYPTWPTYKIFGPCTNPIIRTSDPAGNASCVAFTALTILTDDYVEIDTAARTVRLNGDPVADRYSTIDVTRTIWGPLHPGDPTVTFNAATFAAPSQLLVEWTDAYL